MSDMNWLEILGWDQTHLEDLRFVGYSYIKQGNYAIALKFFEALTVLTTTSEYDVQTLGALYLQTGNNLAALDFLERAIKLNNTHGPTLLNRAKALFLLGYKKQALDQVKLLETHPTADIANQAKALAHAYR